MHDSNKMDFKSLASTNFAMPAQVGFAGVCELRSIGVLQAEHIRGSVAPPAPLRSAPRAGVRYDAELQSQLDDCGQRLVRDVACEIAVAEKLHGQRRHPSGFPQHGESPAARS